MKKKILVTGGSGYKGVKLIKTLIENGYSVINIDKNIFGNYFIHSKNVTNYKLDILDIGKINLNLFISGVFLFVVESRNEYFSNNKLTDSIDISPSQSQINKSNPGIIFSVFLCSLIKLCAA